MSIENKLDDDKQVFVDRQVVVNRKQYFYCSKAEQYEGDLYLCSKRNCKNQLFYGEGKPFCGGYLR